MIPYKLEFPGDWCPGVNTNRSSENEARARAVSRRSVLQQIGFAGLSLLATPALADELVKLPIPSGPRGRPLTHEFPQKGSMILQRTRPPLLETPMEVFDRGVFTPNDQFYVRWHWAVIPNSVDVGTFRLAVRGDVNKALSLSIDDLLKMPRVACGRQSMLRQFARLLPAPRYGSTMGARCHG